MHLETLGVITIKPFKDRSIDPSRKIKVYRNLHKSCFSVKQGGLVVGHTEDISLKDAVFTVNAKSRLKVISTKVKNVHAYVTGFVSQQADLNKLTTMIRYDPYESAYFKTNSGQPVSKAYLASLTDSGCWIP